VAGDGDYAVCYVDMDNFKSVNDAYGFVRGDEMITVLAQTLDRACAEAGDPTPFLGHIGGDDFVVICTPDQAGPLTDRVIALFGPAARALYDPDDLARGYLELGDRQGVLQRFDPVTVSVGVASSTHRTFADPREVVAVATEMKQVAKGTAGSRVAVDRRSLTAGE
jgi:GGDEF domain-containing protein